MKDSQVFGRMSPDGRDRKPRVTRPDDRVCDACGSPVRIMFGEWQHVARVDYHRVALR